MAISKAQQRAVSKYNKNNYDDVKIRVPKGKREQWKESITELGYDSVNKFMINAVDEKIERESK